MASAYHRRSKLVHPQLDIFKILRDNKPTEWPTLRGNTAAAALQWHSTHGDETRRRYVWSHCAGCDNRIETELSAGNGDTTSATSGNLINPLASRRVCDSTPARQRRPCSATTERANVKRKSPPPKSPKTSCLISHRLQSSTGTSKKGKVFPYSLPSVGPGADLGVQAVSPQVT